MAKILTADDSASMRQMVSFTLTGAGHEVTDAVDGADALEKAKADTFDLVLSDVNMPNMDGVTLVKEVRGGGNHRGVPILVLTTEGGDSKKADGKAAGATGWIVKPFTPDKLVQVVNKVCP